MFVKTISVLQAYSSVEEFLLMFPNISRSYVKKVLKKQYRKRPLACQATLSLPEGFLNYGLVNCYEGPPLDILYEDNKFLVVYKKINMHCHPLHYRDQGTVINWMRNYNFILLQINCKAYDRGLLYRLDFATSGGLVYVKAENLLHTLREQMNDQVAKSYYALVEGQAPEFQELSEYLTEDGPKGARMRVAKTGRSARLSFIRIAYDTTKDISLLEIALKTGVRHQIRCQLANLGFPIIGDTLYEGREADRLYLHAYKYSIEEKELFCILPQEGTLFDTFFGLYR